MTDSAVVVVLSWRGRVALFRRSRALGGDVHPWHCLTGFLDGGRHPLVQAAEELWEGAGLSVLDLDRLSAGPVLRLSDPGDGQLSWTVHTFVATTDCRRLALNWKHDAYRWVQFAKLSRFDGQSPWLVDVLAATTPGFRGGSFATF